MSNITSNNNQGTNQIGLEKTEMSQVIDKLNGLLSSYHMFYINVRGYHWNVKGQHFFTLHPKFEELYTALQIQIDEINRANLSSVLGELIYALEYRGEAVESMYEVEGSNKIILPPNLYIIGTMNTADRSVSQIDYAIRRRFAFVDVLPKVLEETDEETKFDEVLFNKVA